MILIQIIIILLQIYSLLTVVYCISTFALPTSGFVITLSRYFNPVLDPIRNVLFRFFPKLKNMRIDFSPIILWLIIDLTIAIFRFLYKII